MFHEERKHCLFQWKDLGNIEHGRENLGEYLPVAVYRLFHYSLRDALIAEIGVEKTDQLMITAGKNAGKEFCRNCLDTALPHDRFLAELQKKFRDNLIGILRIEKTDLTQMEYQLTVAEDLDCSGIAVTDETVCHFDEGFLAGIFECYTGKDFSARETDCWASGARVCRFLVKGSQN